MREIFFCLHLIYLPFVFENFLSLEKGKLKTMSKLSGLAIVESSNGSN
jgi:hypothetical protein